MADEVHNVQIGFSVAQSLSAKLDDKQLQSLRDAVEKETGWWEATTPDGTIALNSAHVLYVKVDAAAHHIGFGSD